jgi:protein-histidine pros-kinase
MQVIPLSALVPLRGHLSRKWHHLLLALGSALVLLLLGSSHWQATASLQALAELRQQAEKVEYLDSLLIQLMDAENAVRGYLLSGNRAHLEPYEKSRVTANQTLEEIRRRLAPGPDHDAALADLSGLVAIKLRTLSNAVERGLAGEETRIQGKRYTDRIRETIFELKTRLAEEGEESFTRSTRHVERTRWVVVTLALGALSLMALLFVVLERQFKLREQISGLLQSENERLDSLVQERTDELSDLASYLTNIREAEKARLARELHDELGALLTAAKMETGWIARHLDDPALAPCREHMARLEERLDDGIALKRKIIDGLRPPLLEMLGLVSTLRTLGEEFIQSDGEVLTIELPEDDIDLAPAPALALFRIAQEALTNIRKHARAHQARLALRVIDGWLELEIDDDGKGFQTAWVRGQHHGLAGMKHRVQMCAGEFSVSSSPGMGTRVVASIPLAANAPAPAARLQLDAASRT